MSTIYFRDFANFPEVCHHQTNLREQAYRIITLMAAGQSSSVIEAALPADRRKALR